MLDTRIPHIKVEVTFGDDTVTHEGGFFIDAIDFLVQAEKAVRRGKKQPIDADTRAITDYNMRKLMREAVEGAMA